MPTWTNINTETLEDFQIAFNNYMRFFVSNLNSKNVKRLDTNETVISSNDGTTTITGPILIQKDSDGTTRIMQGYDAETDTFIYALFNASGDQTIGMNSVTGNAEFTGDITGSTITGGTIRTAVEGSARIELSEGSFKGLTENDRLSGLYFDIDSLGNADIGFYHNDTLLMSFVDNNDSYGIAGSSAANGFVIGNSVCSTYLNGDIIFTNADSIAGLITGTEANHDHSGYTGYAGDGISMPSHRHSISDDGSHYHDITIG